MAAAVGPHGCAIHVGCESDMRLRVCMQATGGAAAAESAEDIAAAAAAEQRSMPRPLTLEGQFGPVQRVNVAQEKARPSPPPRLLLRCCASSRPEVGEIINDVVLLRLLLSHHSLPPESTLPGSLRYCP